MEKIGLNVAMNNFAPATDAAYVYAEDANGNQVKMLKADLVELIRANMPAATKQKDGLLSLYDKHKINGVGVIMYQSGNEITRYYHVARIHNHHYIPIMIEYHYGAYSGIKIHNSVCINYWGSGILLSATNMVHAKSILRYREKGTEYIDVYMIVAQSISCIANITSGEIANIVDITYSYSEPNLSEF